ncbi:MULTISPECIES: PaaI family thioesterase [unclassified Variovorax]|uniref:PaaI family thioesterase n=1 Tax=unclassified Variovorax TaxID=663243 RepID=UPI003F47C36D
MTDSKPRSLSPDASPRNGSQILAAQPFSVLIGAELHAFSPGHAEIQLPLAEQLTQQNGFAHGGIVSYLADNALTFVGGTALRAAVVTSEYKINYVRPAMGQRLIVRAKSVHSGNSQAVCTCEIFALNEDVEKLCALAQGTIAKLPDPPKKQPA